MKLYILHNHFDLGYSCAHNFIVAAEDPESARKLAAKNAGIEGPEGWLDWHKSSCDILEAGDSERVVLKDSLDG